MIVLDTNVLSELMNPRPSPVVVGWLASQPEHLLVTTAITAAEIHAGVAILPHGKRRRDLHARALSVLAPYEDRTLVFDTQSALHYAEVVAIRRAIGRVSHPQDAMIAAICRHHGATLATRNVDDFERIGLDLINPWDAPSGQDAESSGVR
ncbi:MAG: type II toxin-antitoxin system VapC family toxin [Thermomicrobiales bacterium]